MPSRLAHRIATCVAVLGGVFCILAGVNAFRDPAHALSVFHFDLPSPTLSPSDHQLVVSLLRVYGARDIFMGVVTFATAYYGSRKALGWVMLSGAAVAAVDGAVCWRANGGEWTHWGFVPVLGSAGAVLMS
ncbi:hypothetical protein JCM6882_006832 [Rhodosporidiobolus microsporus]